MGFPRGEVILGVLEMSGAPQKQKWAANHQTSPDTGKNCQKPISKHFPLIPTMANDSFLEGNEGNMEEIGGTYTRLRKSQGESQVERYFAGFPGGKLF